MFVTLFMTIAAYTVALKENKGRVFVAGFIDNDLKVVSSKKHTKFKTRVSKPYPIEDQNGQS